MRVDPIMPGAIDGENLGQYLTAFADGELDAVGNLAVLQYVAAHPEAMAMMEQEQRLREAAERVVRADVPAAPQPLRERIEALNVGSEPLHGLRFGIMRAVSFAAAAAILIGFGVVAGRAIAPHPSVAAGASAPLVPVDVIDSATKIHVECSRIDADLHAGGYPQSLEGVADIVKQDLSSANPYPDLTSVGYRYIGAGPCQKYLPNTIHLLYGHFRGRVKDTLSIFVQPYTGQIAIEPAKTYLLAGARAAHPMLVWRSKLAVYYVVGDDMSEVTAATTALPSRI